MYRRLELVTSLKEAGAGYIIAPLDVVTGAITDLEETRTGDFPDLREAGTIDISAL